MSDIDGKKKFSSRNLIIILVSLVGVIAMVGILMIYGIIPSIFNGKGDNVVRYVLEHDESKKCFTYSGERYTMVISYDGKFAVDKFTVDKKTVFQPGMGTYTKYSVDDGSALGKVYSSLQLDKDPEFTVNSENDEIIFTYSDEFTDNTVNVAFGREGVDFTFKRTFKADVVTLDAGFPTFVALQDFTKSVRWNRSGSNFWVGGRASELKSFLAAGSAYRPVRVNSIWQGNVRRSMEDITFTLLSESTNGKNGTAVSFIGDVVEAKEKTEYATMIQRVELEENFETLLPLELTVFLSNDREIIYDGTPDGWGQYGGRTGQQGEVLTMPVNYAAGDSQTIHFTVKCDDYSKYYELGDLKGVNEALLTEMLNDYSRMMIMDYNMGSTLESCNMFMEVPALEQHWNVNLASIYGNPEAIRSVMAGLEIIRNQLQAADGHIRSPYPHHVGDSWGCNYSDMMPSYVMASVDAYRFTGDVEWITSMRTSLEKALEAQHNKYILHDVYVCRNVVQSTTSSNSLLMNDYWEHTDGKFNGYTTPMYYEALLDMAELERTVFKDEAKAAEFEEEAAKVKKDYNELMWSEASGSFLYGEKSHDVVYLPVQGAVLRSGITTPEREQRIILAVEKATGLYDLRYHVMNVLDLLNGKKPANQSNEHKYSQLGMNGGWYGSPDGDFFAAFPLYGDRTLIPKYISGLTTQFNITGFINATCYKRDGINPGDYGWYDLMPTMAYPVWGLYTYGYGFQPAMDRLNILPFIDESMVGSEVFYTWRGERISVKYSGLFDFTLKAGQLPTDVVFGFVNQTPGNSYTVTVNGAESEVRADEDGTVFVTVKEAGETRVVLKNPDEENVAESGTNLALGKPCAPSSTVDSEFSTTFWCGCATDGSTEGDFWMPEDVNGSWLRVELGRRYSVSKVKVFMKSYGSYKYKIQGTNDPTLKEWTTLVNHKKAVRVADDLSLTDKVSGSYSYIRIVFYTESEYETLQVTEMEVYKK